MQGFWKMISADDEFAMTSGEEIIFPKAASLIDQGKVDQALRLISKADLCSRRFHYYRKEIHGSIESVDQHEAMRASGKKMLAERAKESRARAKAVSDKAATIEAARLTPEETLQRHSDALQARDFRAAFANRKTIQRLRAKRIPPSMRVKTRRSPYVKSLDLVNEIKGIRALNSYQRALNGEAFSDRPERI